MVQKVGVSISTTLEEAIQKLISNLNKYNKYVNQEVAAIFNNSFKNICMEVNIPTAEITLDDIFNDLLNDFHTFGEISQRFAVIMLKLDWPPTVHLIPGEVLEIVKLYDEYGLDLIKDKVEEYLIKRFSKDDLNAKLDYWSSKKWLKKRMPILKQAVESHLNGNYYVSVPALLPQIEGIIIDGFGCFGYVKSEKYKSLIENLLASEGKNAFDKQMNKFFLNFVLSKFVHGTDPSSFLSRHAILHGGDTKYGTAANSLKSILVFDYIQDKFK